MRSLCLLFVLLVTSSLTFCQSIPNCNNYSSTATCAQCDVGYHLRFSNLSCDPCCLNCLVCASQDGTCAAGACMSGYTLNSVSQTCEPCPENCFNCTQRNGPCTICNGGYFLNQSSNICQQCPNFCQTCSNSQTCTSCINGYTFNAQTNTCAVPTYTVTNSTGVIVSVVVCLTFAVVLAVLAFYRGKKVALANK
jgi:hypothetical protein